MMQALGIGVLMKRDLYAEVTNSIVAAIEANPDLNGFIESGGSESRLDR